MLNNIVVNLWLYCVRQHLRLVHLQTYASKDTLIALNPNFEDDTLYSQEMMNSYRGKGLGLEPPHIFAMGKCT